MHFSGEDEKRELFCNSLMSGELPLWDKRPQKGGLVRFLTQAYLKFAKMEGTKR